MKFIILISIPVFLIALKSKGQTLITSWHGKKGEVFLISKDSSYADFKASWLQLDRYDFKLSGDSVFLGKVDWRTSPIQNTASDTEHDRQRVGKLIQWFSFKIKTLSLDTLVLECVADKNWISKEVQSFTFFSSQRINAIRNPVFVSLQYDRGGFHIFIDSSGQVKYWFDEANSLQSAGQKVSGNLSAVKMQQLHQWFKSEAIQEIPEYIGSAADGSNKQLMIKSFPKNIFAYGTGNFPDEIQFGLIKFLDNIDKELKATD